MIDDFDYTNLTPKFLECCKLMGIMLLLLVRVKD